MSARLSEPLVNRFRHVLIAQSRRYPQWAVEDIYKLIHQAAMGSEHAAPEEVTAREWLLEEIRRRRSGPDEPLVEDISPDGEVVRVHLRPLVRAGKDAEHLLQAFLRTARGFHGSTERLETYARDAVHIAAEGEFPFSGDELAAYVKQMKQRRFPTVHHSPAFEAEYNPAYRVVARAFLPEDLVAAA